ncbi:hypothetical protein CCACVL1_03829 [Corchorus capsularis]|uniref:Uncharacterized protein n=1 Tax=Corchorus capsularis TaxID=210143 RepID=A0A1R3JX71_COCAP|nr:hypothetical protein CCACVL1_03829 [Corchorus capsularis]
MTLAGERGSWERVRDQDSSPTTSPPPLSFFYPMKTPFPRKSQF